MGNMRSFQKGAGRASDDQFGLIQNKKRKRASRRNIPKLQSQFAELIAAAKKAAANTTILDAAKGIQAVPATPADDNSEEDS